MGTYVSVCGVPMGYVSRVVLGAAFQPQCGVERACVFSYERVHSHIDARHDRHGLLTVTCRTRDKSCHS